MAPAGAHKWLPDWHRGLVWRLGSLFPCINAICFTANAFIPIHLTSAGRRERRVRPYLASGTLSLLSIVGLVLMPGPAAVFWAGLLGFSDGAAPWCPERLIPYNDPKRRSPTLVVASESRNRELPLRTPRMRDGFESVYRPGVFDHLIDVASERAGIELGQSLLSDPTTDYVRVFEFMRDHGIFDRAKAPPYYPAVERSVLRDPV